MMSILRSYFSIQLQIANRKIYETGINPFLGYALGLLLFFIFGQIIFIKTEYAKYSISILCLSFQTRNINLKRQDFLRLTYGEKNTTWIRVIEHSIISLPFVVFLLIKGAWLESSFLLISSIVLAFVVVQLKNVLVFPTPFRQLLFEFAIGFRQTIAYYICALVLLFIAIKADNFNLGLFSFAFVLLLSFGYYTKPEAEYYVWIYGETPRTFLFKKIKIAIQSISYFSLPFVIILSIWYPTKIDMVLVTLLIGIIYLVTYILCKYSIYPREMNLPEGILMTTTVFFPLILFFLVPNFYIKSIKKLDRLLHDRS